MTATQHTPAATQERRDLLARRIRLFVNHHHHVERDRGRRGADRRR